MKLDNNFVHWMKQCSAVQLPKFEFPAWSSNLEWILKEAHHKTRASRYWFCTYATMCFIQSYRYQVCTTNSRGRSFKKFYWVERGALWLSHSEDAKKNNLPKKLNVLLFPAKLELLNYIRCENNSLQHSCVNGTCWFYNFG